MSRPPRFFISPDQATGPHITIAGEDVRHIAVVLRMKPGEILLLRDGQGAEYTVKISSIARDEIRTEIISRATRQIRYPLITLAQGLPKFDKMDFIAQKATELGIASLVPVITERTIVKIRESEKRIARWQKICREAAMQSDRPDIPKVEDIVSFKDFLRTPNSEPRTLLLLPWEEGTKPIRSVLRANSAVRRITVLIGPEGGFSTAEAQLAGEKGFHWVSLGPNILRSETAAIAVLSMIGYEFF